MSKRAFLVRGAPAFFCVNADYMQLVTPKAVPRAVKNVSKNCNTFFQTSLLIFMVLLLI